MTKQRIELESEYFQLASKLQSRSRLSTVRSAIRRLAVQVKQLPDRSLKSLIEDMKRSLKKPLPPLSGS